MAFRFKTGNSNRRGSSTNDSISGKKQGGAGCAIIFGLLFGGAGLAAAFFLGKMFVENLDTYFWDETPCEILSCEIKVDQSDEDSPFSLDVRYRYAVDGKNFEGSKLTLEADKHDDYTDLAIDRERLLSGTGRAPTSAYVDPDDATNAILKRRNLFFLSLWLLFPLPFIGIGFGMVYFTIVQGKKKKAESNTGGLSSKANKDSRAGRVVGLVIFTILLLVGIGLTGPLIVKPIGKATAAKTWPETPCKIIWSRVQTHEGDDGDTYSVDIFYEYEFEGQTHRSNRYGFIGGSSSGYDSKKAITQQYPRGSTQSCYVNPGQPLEAVLKPDLGLGVLLGLVPLILVLIGAGGLFAMLKKGHKTGAQAQRFSATSPTGYPDLNSDSPDQPIEFQPGGKRLAGFFIAVAIALFWNGIVSVFLWQVVESFRAGSPEWFLTIFMIPFVLVGLLIIGGVFYTFFALFTPKPVVTVSPGSPKLGEEFRVSWRLRGSSGRLKNLRITVSGHEKASYRQGTNTRTDSETFYRRELALVDRQGIDLIQGEGRISLPLDLCPTVKLGNNEIEWSIKVEGEIPLSPDLQDRYVITVRPAI